MSDDTADEAYPHLLTPKERAKLEVYCEFFGLSLRHLLDEEQPPIPKAEKIIAAMLYSRNKAETCVGYCAEIIAQLGLDKDSWFQLGLKQPALWATRPQSLQKTIADMAALLARYGATPDRLLRMAFKNPAIFLTNPQALFKRINTIAGNYSMFGLTGKRCFDIYEKLPGLVSLLPDKAGPKIDRLLAAQRAGILQFPEPDSETKGTVADYLVRQPGSLMVNLVVLEMGIILARRSAELKGRPVKSLKLSKTEQDRLANHLDELEEKSRSRQIVWKLIEDEGGKYFLQLGENPRQAVSASAAVLLQAIAKEALTPASRTNHASLEKLTDNFVMFTASRIRAATESLGPIAPLLTGNYAKDGLRLGEGSSLIVESRKPTGPS